MNALRRGLILTSKYNTVLQTIYGHHRLLLQQSYCQRSDNNENLQQKTELETDAKEVIKHELVADEIDLSYFKSVVQNLSKKESREIVKSEHQSSSVRKPIPEISQFSSLKPQPPSQSATLAAYANESDTLKRLLQLGVDLSKVEKNQDAANHILKADFEQSIQPYLWFLNSAGVPDSELGVVITKEPEILLKDMDFLKNKISYLESKSFTLEAIGRIISKAPTIMLMTTKQIDTKLGVLQQEFKLSGDEVRFVVTRNPKLATWNSAVILDSRLAIERIMGFSSLVDQKSILISCPKLYLRDKEAMLRSFDYLHNEMGITHKQILDWPLILRTRLFLIKQRHQYLASIDRAQYNPEKENYVPLKALVTGKDKDFCKNVAKASVVQYNEFLKTM